jgi:hypothetical protein
MKLIHSHYKTSLKNLDDAYNGFLRKEPDFQDLSPNTSKNSFKIPQFVKIENGKLRIPKFNEPIDLILS